MAGESPEGAVLPVAERVDTIAGNQRPAFSVVADAIVNKTGHIAMWLNFALILAIVGQVFLRYTFSVNLPKLDEIQWHFYGVASMISLSFTVVADRHVRVDVLHSRLAPGTQRLIELAGLLFLVTPFLYLMIDQGSQYFLQSYRVNEASASPVGLPALWAFKAFIPVSFLLLALSSLSRFVSVLNALWTDRDPMGNRTGDYGLLGAIVFFWALAILLLSLLVDTTEERLVIAMFCSFIALLFTGFPIAWTLAGTGVAFCGLVWLFDNDYMTWTGLGSTLLGLDYRTLGTVVNRVYAVMSNAVLVALPMFIFMGLMLDASGIAGRLMKSMQRLFGPVRGGLAICVTLIGIVLAASTGIIGASVVLLGVLSLPMMMRENYSRPLATGVVAASGTLGILIPPSIMLVIMADQMGLSVGDLFMGAVFPGLLIGGLYLGWIILLGWLAPGAAPAPKDARPPDWRSLLDLLVTILPPLLLILSVLGSIFAGLATPTEASGIGAAGAMLLAAWNRQLSFRLLRQTLVSTFTTSSYVFAIFLGATVFAYVLRQTGGDELIEKLVMAAGSDPVTIIVLILTLVFLLGFILDWLEISLIILPLMRPIVDGLDIAIPDFGTVNEPVLVWFVILVAVTLQTSFLTPPVGFALFYIRGVCPPEIRLSDIYRGVIPFVLLQLLGLVIVFFFPALVTWLPSVAY